MSHYPVMLAEVIEQLSPRDGGIYVDGTFGAGGYSAAILDQADCQVVAIDRDPAAAHRAQVLQKKYGSRLTFLSGCFGDVASLLKENKIEKIDGFVLDLGVSSFQIDEGERGFSFRFDGPLDMRMNPHEGQSAADLVNAMAEDALADLIYKYGEERKSRWVAKRVVKERKDLRIETTAHLADIVRASVPKSRDGIDPATRTFQALRIAVNDELGELERALEAAPDILAHKGRMVVVSFHSLEDRIVKNTFRALSGKQGGSRYAPVQEEKPSQFEIITRKAVKPSAEECSENSRSRSAKLRAIEYTGGAS